MTSAEFCHVADATCEAPAGLRVGNSGLANGHKKTRGQCVRCGQPVCRACSRHTRAGRVCNDCHDDATRSKQAARTLEPVDLTRCQSMRPNGATFLTLGGVPGLVRCTEKPTLVATERAPNPKDGLVGSMSLCDDCGAVLQKHEPGRATLMTVAAWRRR